MTTARLFPGLDSLALPESDRPLKVCIATEDIAGPARNGGIGSTYASLADLLAQAGHDCTVLYLRGRRVDDADIEAWTARFASRGVRFVAVPDVARHDGVRKAGEPWIATGYNLLAWLLRNPMDVVHLSEWGGAGHFALVAKNQKVAFHQTHFVVKASSPWLWSRTEGLQPLDRVEDLSRIHAERRSIELADHVVCGSQYLLDWMTGAGYRLPAASVFVQPNVVQTPEVAAIAGASAGHAVEELVFFGRLETRKGVELFCRAVTRLIRQGAPPKAVTFLGRPGPPLAARPEIGVLDYIHEQAAGWPFPVRFLTDHGQQEALAYLGGSGRLAVMPSLAENSSLAIYECLLLGLPFIASLVGGAAELVHPEDADAVLCPPDAAHLANRLAIALAEGATTARPSFDNAANLESWRRFHRRLAALTPPTAPARAAMPAITACLYAPGEAAGLKACLSALRDADASPAQLVVAVERPLTDAERAAFPGVLDVDVARATVAKAFNQMLEAAKGELVLLLRQETRLEPWALAALTNLSLTSGAELVTGLCIASQPGRSTLVAPRLRGDLIETLEPNSFPAPILIRRSALSALGGCDDTLGPFGVERVLLLQAERIGLRVEILLAPFARLASPDPGWLADQALGIAAAAAKAGPLESAIIEAGAAQSLLLMRGLRPPAIRRSGPTQRINIDGPYPPPATVAAYAEVAPPPEAAEPSSPGFRFLAWRGDAMFLELEDSRDRRFEIDAARRSNRRLAFPAAVDPARAVVRLNAHKLPDNLTVRRSNTPHPSLKPPHRAAHLGELEGYCDPSDDGFARGWVWDPSAPDAAVDVAVFIDRRFLARVSADEPREDQRHEGVGEGDYGFTVPLPRLARGRTYRIDVVVADTGAPLMRSPMFVRPNPIP